MPCSRLVDYLVPSCYNLGCSRTTDADMIHKKLTAKIFGQPTALEEIRSNLKAAFSKDKEKDRDSPPLAMHFAGECGAGKTESALIISEYAFKIHIGRRKQFRSSLMFVNGGEFGHDPTKPRPQLVQKYVHRLKSELSAKLRKCRRIIVVFDDIQKMIYEVLVQLAPVFEGHYEHKGIRYSTSQIIIILTSDFGYGILNRYNFIQEQKVIISKKLEQYLNYPRLLRFIVNIAFLPVDEHSIQELMEVSFKSMLSHLPLLQIPNRFDIIQNLTSVWKHITMSRDPTARKTTDQIADLCLFNGIQQIDNMLRDCRLFVPYDDIKYYQITLTHVIVNFKNTTHPCTANFVINPGQEVLNHIRILLTSPNMRSYINTAYKAGHTCMLQPFIQKNLINDE